MLSYCFSVTLVSIILIINENVRMKKSKKKKTTSNLIFVILELSYKRYQTFILRTNSYQEKLYFENFDLFMGFVWACFDCTPTYIKHTELCERRRENNNDKKTPAHTNQVR